MHTAYITNAISVNTYVQPKIILSKDGVHSAFSFIICI